MMIDDFDNVVFLDSEVLDDDVNAPVGKVVRSSHSKNSTAKSSSKEPAESGLQNSQAAVTSNSKPASSAHAEGAKPTAAQTKSTNTVSPAGAESVPAAADDANVTEEAAPKRKPKVVIVENMPHDAKQAEASHVKTSIHKLDKQRSAQKVLGTSQFEMDKNTAKAKTVNPKKKVEDPWAVASVAKRDTTPNATKASATAKTATAKKSAPAAKAATVAKSAPISKTAPAAKPAPATKAAAANKQSAPTAQKTSNLKATTKTAAVKNNKTTEEAKPMAKETTKTTATASKATKTETVKAAKTETVKAAKTETTKTTKAEATKVTKAEATKTAAKAEATKATKTAAPAKATATAKAAPAPVAETKAPKAEPVKSSNPYETVIIEGDPDTAHGKFVIKHTDNDKFVFKLFSSNKRVVAVSAGPYTSYGACKNGVQSVINNSATAPIEDQTLKNVNKQKFPKWTIYLDKRGEFRLRLYATNGEMVAATNDGYLSKDAAKKGIDAIARAAKGADVVRNDDLW